MTYKPESFGAMVDDAVASVQAGLKDGFLQMEVEFPPVPVALDGYKGASDVFIDSNVQLALAAAKRLAAGGRRVHVVAPDQGEYDRTYTMFKPALQLSDGVSLGHLGEAGGPSFSLNSFFRNQSAPSSSAAAAAADTYIIINATSVELAFVEKYGRAAVAAGKAVVLWNLELDTLKGDLGLVPYPSKDTQYKYLCYFKPVFYLRPRDYSKTVNVAPFVVNYSGALFREYPGPWQAMLRQDNGEYACIAEDIARFNLGDLKEELMSAMGINTEEEGSAMSFLRRGFKTSTWFEDDYDLEESHVWRL
ncbi:MAG: hypothetical protein WDW36_004805 [Sanguina aurantia]